MVINQSLTHCAVVTHTLNKCAFISNVSSSVGVQGVAGYRIVKWRKKKPGL